MHNNVTANPFSAGTVFIRQNLTSVDVESDVCRRQILTYKDGPRTERSIVFLKAVDPKT